MRKNAVTFSTRSSKTYNKSIVDESEHLKKYISPGVDDKHFSCSACKGSDRLFENLLIHVESDAHEKKIPSDSDTQIKRKRALLLLFKKGFKTKIGGYSEETLFPPPLASAKKDNKNQMSSGQKEVQNPGSPTQELEDFIERLADEPIKHETEPIDDCQLAFKFEISKFILENDLPLA